MAEAGGGSLSLACSYLLDYQRDLDRLIIRNQQIGEKIKQLINFDKYFTDSNNLRSLIDERINNAPEELKSIFFTANNYYCNDIRKAGSNINLIKACNNFYRNQIRNYISKVQLKYKEEQTRIATERDTTEKLFENARQNVKNAANILSLEI